MQQAIPGPKVALSADFLLAFSRIPSAQQKKVREFTEKFRRDPTQRSINYEPIHDMKDKKVRTVRIGDDYRAIVISPPAGDVYLLVWVDHHDEAMAWARNKRFEVNPAIGSLQVFEVSESQEAIASAGAAQAVAQPRARPIPEGRLLCGLTDDDLQICGVPERLLPSVRALRFESDLDELAPYLPQDASDALYLLAAGTSLDEVLEELDRARSKPKVDTKDFLTALEHPDSQRRFKLIDSEKELMEVLAAPLAQWRIFLHPSQRRLVQMQAKGPVRVLGGAGTGKTVVLMHRAKYLAADVFNQEDDRILVTTFTRNLAVELAHQVKELCGPESSRIEIANLHQWAVQFLRSQGLKLDVATEALKRELWEIAVGESAPDGLPQMFFREEWEKVVQAQEIRDLDGYMAAKRTGRGTALTRRQRAEVWAVLNRYRALLDERRKVEWPDVVRETRLFLDQHPGRLPYRAVLSDEVQDFSPSDLRLLRSLAPKGENDLFVVGDAHQRIYGNKSALGRCGIDVRGRSRRLKINYRTTEEVRNWAVALLEAQEIDDLDDGKDTLKGYRSLRTGPAPEVQHFSDSASEGAFIVSRLKTWLSAGPAEEVCIAARTKDLILDRYLPLLSSNGIPAVVIETEAEGSLGPGVRLATMHRLKGLEFPKVLVAAVQDGVVPLRVSQESLADQASEADHEIGERSLLYVAATRARDELVLSGFGKQCPFLVNAPKIAEGALA